MRVADIAPLPWRNGGGVTRELLAWPDPHDWQLRVSVADICASGPFSVYPGVDRWFAVLDGGGVCLKTAGAEPRELTPAQPALHAFPGDVPTHCTTHGPITRDFNLMARRSSIRLRHHALKDCSRLETCAEGVGLFVVHATDIREEAGPVCPIPDMALAWWPNPQRAQLSLRVESAGRRGWWFELDTNWQRAP